MSESNQRTNLPRSVWIGGGIAAVLGLLLICGGAGIGVGFWIGAARREAVPVPVPEAPA